MSERGLRKADPETVVKKLVARATLTWNLIEDGDRVLIAASGGKDSTALAWALQAVRRAIGKKYELIAVHIAADFPSSCDTAVLSARFSDWGIPLEIVRVPVIGRLKPGRKMNCYWCSTQRRTELLRYAAERGYNKIALGHHLDDIIETFFMNLLQKGEMIGMPAKLEYEKYPVTLIRPLAMLEERQIIEYADAADILKSTCTCAYGNNSERRAMRAKIAALTGNSGHTKRRILAGLSSGAKDLLLELRSSQTERRETPQTMGTSCEPDSAQ